MVRPEKEKRLKRRVAALGVEELGGHLNDLVVARGREQDVAERAARGRARALVIDHPLDQAIDRLVQGPEAEPLELPRIGRVVLHATRAEPALDDRGNVLWGVGQETNRQRAAFLRQGIFGDELPVSAAHALLCKRFGLDREPGPALGACTRDALPGMRKLGRLTRQDADDRPIAGDLAHTVQLFDIREDAHLRIRKDSGHLLFPAVEQVRGAQDERTNGADRAGGHERDG